MNEGEKNIQKQVNIYRDNQGISTRRLDFGLWYMKNRHNFIVLLTWLLITCVILSWFYFLYNLGVYVFNGKKQDDKNLEELSKESLVLEKKEYDKNIAYNFLAVLPSSGSQFSDKYDLVGEIKNNNSNVLAKFDYYFIINGLKTERKSDFIFPNDQKKIVSLGVDLSGTDSPSLVVENIIFKKINKHSIPDWEIFKKDRTNFVTSNVGFIESKASGLSEKNHYNDFSFDISNETAYDYATLKIIIVLEDQSGELLSVGEYFINNFFSRENKKIRISWPGDFSKVDNIIIIPDVNILDEQVYLKVK